MCRRIRVLLWATVAATLASTTTATAETVVFVASDAPGANDDASGVALMIELARVLSKEHLDGRLIYDAPVQRWLDQFLDIWIGRADDLAENRPAPLIGAEQKLSA